MSQFDQFPSLRDLPVRSAPAELTMKLRVLASRELSRRRLGSLRSFDRVRLLIENGMRPMALPVIGGVFSAIVLFSMFLPPVYPLRPLNSADIPTMLTTTAILKGTAPVGVTNSDVVVDVMVGEDGRMVDYTIISGPVSAHDAEWQKRLENALLFTVFTPATSFGQPTTAKKRLYLDSSSVEVRG